MAAERPTFSSASVVETTLSNATSHLPRETTTLIDLLHEGVERIFEIAKEAGRRVIVQVDLRGTVSILDAALRKRIEQEAGHLIRSLKPPGLCEKKRLEGFSIEVLDTPDLAEAKAHALAHSVVKPGGWLIAPSVMRAGDVQKVSRGVPVPSMRLGWFIVNYDLGESVDEMKRLADTIEAKVAQVRRASDDALGLMVPITKFARLASRFRADSATWLLPSEPRSLIPTKGWPALLSWTGSKTRNAAPTCVGCSWRDARGNTCCRYTPSLSPPNASTA